MGAEARARAAAASESASTILNKIQNQIPAHHHQLIDAYGRPIVVGGVYGYSAGLPTPVTIVDISPILAPNVPPDTYRVTCMAQVDIRAMSRAPIRNLIYIDAGLGAQAPGPQGDQAQAQPQNTQAQAGEEKSSIILTDL